MDKSEHLYTGGRKAYLDKTRERVRALEKARYAKDKESAARKKRAWRNKDIEGYRAWQRARYKSNIEYFRERSRRRYRADPGQANAIHRKYYQKNREALLFRNRIARQCPVVKSKRAAKLRLRRKTDINFRIETDCRNMLRSHIKSASKRHGQKITKCQKASELLGCSLENFKIYIESKFEPGMTWENWSRTGWHIDHIIPCAIFDLTKPEHQKRCFHFSNLQPLWAMDNYRKHCDVGDNQFRLL